MPSPSSAPPTASNSVRVTGTVLFVATLSPSFTLFALDVTSSSDGSVTIKNKNSKNNDNDYHHPLDVVLKIKTTSNKRNSGNSNGNGNNQSNQQQQERERLRRVRGEIQRCYVQQEPLTVHGWKPLEPCPCRQYVCQPHVGDNCNYCEDDDDDNNNNNKKDDETGTVVSPRGFGGSTCSMMGNKNIDGGDDDDDDDEQDGACPHAILHCWNVNDLPVLLAKETTATDETHDQQLLEPLEYCRYVSSSSSAAAAAAAAVPGLTNDHDAIDNNWEASSCARLASSAVPAEELNKNKGSQHQKQQESFQNNGNNELNSISNSKRPRRAKVRNGARAARFVDALLDAMGPCLHNNSNSNAGVVLDVAGGGSGGGVAFELSLRRHIASTIIDPRPVQWNAARRRTLQFRETARVRLQPHCRVSHQAAALCERRFRPWRVSQRCERFPTVNVREHWEQIAEAGGDDDDNGNNTHLWRLVKECRAIVGLHPDEATDAIIHTALLYRKPWAVVPCCVFPNTFSNRTLRGGKSVRTYNDLCAYILSVAHGVKEITLDFEGRNKMYYWIPEEFQNQSGY